MLPESTCGDVRDDTAAFVRQLRAYAEGAKVHGKVGNRPPEHPVERVVEDMFDWSAPVRVARAPGRWMSWAVSRTTPAASCCRCRSRRRATSRCSSGTWRRVP